MESANKYLKKVLTKNDKVVIACSGGADSMALLSLLTSLKQGLNLTIICAHINHNIRKESEYEAEMVESFCKKHQIIFEYMIIKKYNKDNFHQDARNQRYQYFEELIKKHNAKYLMTAHHADDLMESILMKISRGSNLNGYSGFNQCVDKQTYKILRPLFEHTKEEILKYNKQKNIEYCNDASNDKDDYTRNRYRHTMLTFLKEENKNIHQKYLNFHKTIKNANKYIEKSALEVKNKIYQKNQINLKEFNKLEEIIQTKVIELILLEVYQHKINLITTKHIENIIKLINNNKSNLKIKLPNNLIIVKSYQKIIFQTKEEVVGHYNLQLKEKLLLPNNKTISIENNCDLTNNYCTRINSKEIKLPLMVRTKQPGDNMVLKTMLKTKKIKDIFINSKISLDKRSSWPIVTDANNEIIWLPGLKKSKFDKNKDEFYDIIIKYERKEEKNEQKK